MEKKTPVMKKSKKTLVFSTFLGLVAALAVTFSSFAAPSYLKAATYSGDTWVINFWSSEMDHLDEDMAQIAADGFNGIILIVPWREFQPQAGTFNSYAFEKLDQVMNAAEAHGLWVTMRISYRWDFYNGSDFGEYYLKLIYDDSTRSVWRSYIERVYQAASAHSNFYGGFLCWEDFWDNIPSLLNGAPTEDRISTAELIGYQDYLREHYTLDEVNAAYQTASIGSYDQVYLPSSMFSPGAQLFYDFYDDVLQELLWIGQQVFPDLSMEVRLDQDVIEGSDGSEIGVVHYKTFGCMDSSYTSLVYSVYMGQIKGQDISAAQALAQMRDMLDLVRQYNEGKPIFIDQLLYMDNTEAFSYNPQIHPEELPSFITQLAPILRDYTNGYGVWAYRNYKNSPLYNYGFALGSRGWVFNTLADVVQRNGSSALHLKPYGSVSQRMSRPPEGQRTHDNYVSFKADSDSPVTLQVTLGALTKEVEINGPQDVEINFGKLEYNEISFTALGDVWIDDIFVYNFIQDGQLYDCSNNELSCIEAIRTLNSELN